MVEGRVYVCYRVYEGVFVGGCEGVWDVSDGLDCVRRCVKRCIS